MGRCGTRYDKRTKTSFWMPGCVGGAAMGDAYCTCSTSREIERRAATEQAWRDSVETRLQQLERHQ